MQPDSRAGRGRGRRRPMVARKLPHPAGGVGAGNFTDSLFCRLSAFAVRVPPLRERLEDIPGLIQRFLTQTSADPGSGPGAPQTTQTAMAQQPAPARARVLQRAARLTRGGPIAPEQFHRVPTVPGCHPGPVGGSGALTILPLAEFERRYLVSVLEHTNGVIHGQRGAARLLGLKPTTLRSRMEKLGITGAGRPASQRLSGVAAG